MGELGAMSNVEYQRWVALAVLDHQRAELDRMKSKGGGGRVTS